MISKKGVMMLNMLMFAMIAVLIIIIIYLGVNMPTIKFVGSTQIAVINTFEFSERTFLYLDISSSLSSKEARKFVLSNAGFFGLEFVSLEDIYPCSKVVYPVLNDEAEVEKCLPDYKNSLLDAFKISFEKFISKYKQIRLRAGDFSFDLQSDDVNIKFLVDGISPIQIPFYTRSSAYYDDRSAFFSSEQGVCSKVVEYAAKYLGSGYGGTGDCPAELAGKKNEPGKCTTQCGSFVTNVYKYSISEEAANGIRGNGIDKCNGPGIARKFSDSALLQPGDIFSSTSPSSQFGHTGIYVGKGRVENAYTGKNSCFSEFIPDLLGEPVFIHSIGPVCFSTLKQLVEVQKRDIISFCRADACIQP